MIVEIPITLAYLYPSLNLSWFKKHRPVVEKEITYEPNPLEGIEIYKYVTKYTSPTYVNVGNIILPINNSDTYQEHKLLTTKYYNKEKTYTMYNSIDEDNKSVIEHINTPSSLTETFKKYNICENEYSITLPLKINHYNYTKGAYLHNSGILSGNKDKLIKKVLFDRRLPLSITIPSIATAYVACCWIKYYLYNSYNSTYNYHSDYYPPFHYKRFKNNFK